MTEVHVARAFIARPPAVVADRVRGPEGAPRLFAGADLAVTEDRAAKGCRWSISSPFSGSAEVWLEPALDGCILHAFLRADEPPADRWPGFGRRLRAGLWAFKDTLEADGFELGASRPVKDRAGSAD